MVISSSLKNSKIVLLGNSKKLTKLHEKQSFIIDFKNYNPILVPLKTIQPIQLRRFRFLYRRSDLDELVCLLTCLELLHEPKMLHKHAKCQGSIYSGDIGYIYNWERIQVIISNTIIEHGQFDFSKQQFS